MMRVLHLEDEPDFSALVAAIMEKEGMDAELFAVTDFDGFKAALEETSYDLILADYMLPTCNGLQALQVVREKYPLTPVILLSGAIGEQGAIEVLRAGATDYVLKSRLDRLVPSMQRALQESEERAQRTRAEAEARQSEAQYRLIFDGSPVPIWVADLQSGAVLEVNSAAVRQYGYDREEFLTKTVNDLCAPEEAPRMVQTLAGLAGQQPENAISRGGVWRHQRKDGTPMDMDITWSLIRFQERDAVLIMAHQIIEPGDTAEALKKSEASLAAAQRIAQLGSWVLDLEEGKALEELPLRWSDETYRIFGYKPRQSPATTAQFLSSPRPEDRSRLREAIERAMLKREPFEIEHRIVLPEGEERVVRQRAEFAYGDDGAPLQLRGIVMDITERKRLEEQLHQTQKMDAIGELAGEVAHGFNNILTVTHGHALLLLGEKNLSKSAKESARTIAHTAERAASLTQSLLAFSRRQTMQPRRLDLNDLIQNLTVMLERVLGEDIALEFKRDPQPAIVQADGAMMEQVLLSLAMNARESMPKGGKLMVEVSSMDLNPDNLNYHPEGREGKFICLSVADNGQGIPPETLRRIFEPFSGKETGKRGDLGMAAAYGIIKQHEGWVEAESEPGNGTTFRVYLPLNKEKDETPAKKSAKAPRGGDETVLVVEDEEPVRELVCRVLTAYGYKVLSAASGPKALDLWRKTKGDVDLLLTDVVFPDELNGRELADKLRRSRPQLKVIFSSGYSMDILGKDFVLQRGQVFLQKPYDLQKLAQTVRTCLDRAR